MQGFNNFIKTRIVCRYASEELDLGVEYHPTSFLVLKQPSTAPYQRHPAPHLSMLCLLGDTFCWTLAVLIVCRVSKFYDTADTKNEVRRLPFQSSATH